MGQKVPPLANRLGFIKGWEATWFSKGNFAQTLHEDLTLRNFVKKKFHHTGISHVKIERAGKAIRINIHTARPGIVIGKGGQDIEGFKNEIETLTSKKIYINIVPVKKPQIDPQIIAEGVALQIEKKVPFRRVMKRTIQRAMESGAQGIKICISGRLGGAEIARSEWLKDGRIPLGTFRADIDYGFTEAFTKYGKIGIKVWVFKEEVIKKKPEEVAEPIPKEAEKKETGKQEDKKTDKKKEKQEDKETKGQEDKKIKVVGSPSDPEGPQGPRDKQYAVSRKQETEGRKEEEKKAGKQEDKETKKQEDKETKKQEDDKEIKEQEDKKTDKKTEKQEDKKTDKKKEKQEEPPQ